MVINMLANDLDIPVEPLDKVSSSQNVDIFINTLDEDAVYNKSQVEMVWPHYQNRYCLIYANTRLIFAGAVLNYKNLFNLLSILVWIITYIFFFIVYRYRYGLCNFEIA